MIPFLTCGKCLRPIEDGETGIRHFGQYKAHAENRCVELLIAALNAKDKEAMHERRERQYWTQQAEKLLHKLAAAEANYASAAAVTGNMMREYAEMRDRLAEIALLTDKSKP